MFSMWPTFRQVVLLDFDLVERGSQQKRLDSVYAELKEWCSFNGQNLHMIRLTADLLGLASSADYPQALLGNSYITTFSSIDWGSRLIYMCIYIYIFIYPAFLTIAIM